jgi:ribosomal protein L10
MQIDALKDSFQGVRNMVLFTVKGLSAINEGNLRTALRKKQIKVRVVKNTYTRKVFAEMGIDIPANSPIWKENTAVAWGGNSIADLSKAIDGELKGPKTAALYKDKLKIKTAIADGTPVPFEAALKMPTREEAIANVLGAILGAASRLVAAFQGPAAGVSGQVTTISEKAEEAAPAEAPAEAAPAEAPPGE